MNKKAVIAIVAAAVVVAYGTGTWWAGHKVRTLYQSALADLSASPHSAWLRVVEQRDDPGYFSARSNLTLEIGCAADPASPAPDAHKPIRIGIRNTIHPGPYAGGTLAAATIDTELVLDAASQAEAAKLFGAAQPLTAHTRIGFDGGYVSDITMAPAKFTDAEHGQITWQGARARVDVNAPHTRMRYELTLPGLDASNGPKGTQVKAGQFSAQADLDTHSGWALATGKTEARLASLEFEVPAGARSDAPLHVTVPKTTLEDIELLGNAEVKDGLYASTATVKGHGKVGDTAIDVDLTSSIRRIQADGYQKVADTWLRFAAVGACGRPGNAKALADMQVVADRLEPTLKAMAKDDPEIGVDKMVLDIGGKRGELSYMAGLAGVTDADLKDPGMQLLMKRGVLKASARIPTTWLHRLAEAGAGTGKAPPPELVTGLVEQGERDGYIKHEGEDVTSQVEFSDGSLKINGKPVKDSGG